jgi:peptidoglycan hydrolase CwlO-like protein
MGGLKMKTAAEKAPGWLQRILLPELSEIKGELKAVNARIDSLNTKIEGTNTKIDEMDKRLSSEIAGLRELVNLTQRVTILEAKVKEQETRKQ